MTHQSATASKEERHHGRPRFAPRELMSYVRGFVLDVIDDMEYDARDSRDENGAYAVDMDEADYSIVRYLEGV